MGFSLSVLINSNGNDHQRSKRVLFRFAPLLSRMNRPCLLKIFVLFGALSVPAPAATVPIPDKIEFNRDVRPILSDNCFNCHGPDSGHRKAKLRLDVREVAIEKKAFIPGDVEQSEMLKRLVSSDPDELMPPPESHKKLTPEQKAVLRRWVEQGGKYQQHWSYEIPQKAQIPPGQNGVDALVRARQNSLHLKFSPEADRRVLIRRLYADLLGLPPTFEEVEAFVSDKNPDAYGKVVAGLLKNPHYGERMAQGWLDVVRFADTIGYHSDNPRNVWPYRDWVIKAFNDNKRFDRFTLEQIAGDLLPDANQETKVASAFNRLLLSTEEGGAQSKDYELRMLTDRVRALGAAWMGQTTGCAQCHDHKFDPITSKDFYSLGAFFADIKEPIIGKREDGMALPSSEQTAKIASMEARERTLRAELDAASPERSEKQKRWEESLLGGTLDVDWTTLHPVKLYGDRGSKFTQDGDGVVSVSVEGRAASDTYFVTVTTPPGLTSGFKLEAISSDALPGKGPGLSANGNFILNQLTVKEGDKVLKVSEVSATYEQKGYPAKLAIDPKSSNDAKKGWANLGNELRDASLYVELEKPVAGERTLTVILRQIAGDHQTLGKFRLLATASPKPIRAPGVQFPKELLQTISLPVAKRSAAQKEKISKHFRAVASEFGSLREALADAIAERAEFEKALTHCLVSVSTEVKRVVKILPRGNFLDESGMVVKAALPHYLPQPKIEGREPNRLDLAQWLVSRDNPLTARTVMNRLWKQFFGIGLSKVLDDLGAQGEPPLNGPLLDWLACEFMDSGWDMTHMVRTIVNSATYKQASSSTSELIASDPYNRELARQSTFRLDAELVRDNALSIAGLLVPTIGGPSAKPYQPARYWENLNFPAREYENDKNENQYRRGLYTWWQRSFLHPSLVAFDAPSREESCAERNRSNIPQQALVLLNDPTYVEAARAFAVRILTESKGDSSQKLAWAFGSALQRKPRPEELATLLALIQKHSAIYQDNPAGAEALMGTGMAPVPAGLDKRDIAVWTHVARVLLNLHETITRA